MTAKFDAAGIVERIRSGSKQAEAELVQRYRKGLVLMLEQRSPNHAAAEDLAHETLIIVLKKLRSEGLEQPSALAGYVRKTAKYVAIGSHRKKDSQLELTDDADALPTEADNNSAIEQLARMQLQQVVRAMLQEIKVDRDREILSRFYVQEQSKGEICEALDLSREHFDRVLHRAKKRCREIAEHKYPGLLNRLV